jgi:histidinol-phosphatase (PHP family)
MALEVSSAGLRKPCAEIYPGPSIMRMAAEMKLPITIASDAHCTRTPAYAFDQLEAYVRSFGYEGSFWFQKGKNQFKAFN